MLLNNQFADAVREDERRAVELGIRSIPCFVVDGNTFVGAGSFASLKAYLQGAAVPT